MILLCKFRTFYRINRLEALQHLKVFKSKFRGIQARPASSYYHLLDINNFLELHFQPSQFRLIVFPCKSTAIP